MKARTVIGIITLAIASLFLTGCGGDSNKASIDRFSAAAGHLFVRDGADGLPKANEPINFDQVPFITQGLGPNGEIVKYYNFDE